MCCSLPHCESSVTPSCSPETRESLGGNKGVLPSRSHLKLPLLHPCLIELEKESGWLDPSPTAYSWRASQVGTVDLGFWQQSVKKKKNPLVLSVEEQTEASTTSAGTIEAALRSALHVFIVTPVVPQPPLLSGLDARWPHSRPVGPWADFIPWGGPGAPARTWMACSQQRVNEDFGSRTSYKQEVLKQIECFHFGGFLSFSS